MVFGNIVRGFGNIVRGFIREVFGGWFQITVVLEDIGFHGGYSGEG